MTNQTMSKSNLINHINHLRIEINVLKNRQEERVNQKKLELQSHSINSTYSWDVRAIEWKKFLSEIK